MATRYVATAAGGGVDGAAGTIGAPWRTFAYACTQLSGPGDTIIVRGGAYNEGLNSNPGGVGLKSGSSWSLPFTITGYPGETVTITRGSMNTPIGCTQAESYIIFQDMIIDGQHNAGENTIGGDGPTHHLRYLGLEVKNAGNQGIGHAGNFHEIISCNIHSNGDNVPDPDHGIYLSGTDVIVRDCLLHNNAFSGLQAYPATAERWQIYNNRAYANPVVGIQVCGPDHLVHHNLCYNNGNTGLELGVPDSGNGATRTGVYFNVCYANVDYGIYVTSSSVDAILKNNACWGSNRDIYIENSVLQASGTVFTHNITGNAIVNDGSGGSSSNNVLGTPGWANPGAGIFTITTASPAHWSQNPGVAIAGITADFIGTGLHDPPSRGAYEPIGEPGGGGGITGWEFRSPIVVDNAKVPNTNQTNFPVLIDITDNRFRTVANGGNVRTGLDIIPYLETTLTTPMSFDLKYHNPVTGQIVMRILVPSLLTASDTTFQLAYGNVSVTTPQGGYTTWNSNCVARYALGDGTTLSLADSTVNNNDGVAGVAAPTAAAGKHDGAAAFNGTTQNINLGSPANMIFGTGNFTLLGGFKTSDTGTRHIFRHDAAGTFIGLRIVTGGFAQCFSAGAVTGVVNLADGNWHMMAMVRSGNTVELYVDGASIGTDTAVVNFGGSTEDWFVGSNANPTPIEFWNGSLEELQVWNTALSADWLATEWNQFNDQATFRTLGAEVAVSAATAIPVIVMMHARRRRTQ